MSKWELPLAGEETRRADELSACLAAIADSSDDAIAGVGLDGIILSWNPGAERLSGYSAGEIIGQPVSLLWPPDSIDGTLGFVERIARGETILNDETERMDKSGKRVQLSLSIFPIRDSEGHVTGGAAIARDITQRKQAEAARQESETAFRALADSVPQMVWMCTPDGLNVYFNQRWVDYTGMTLADSYGRGWNTPFHPDDQQPAWDAWNHATETGETYRIESRLRAADGSYRWFLMRGLPLRDAAGRIVKWFGTCTDIDDLKRGEEALRNLNEELEKRVEERTAQLREQRAAAGPRPPGIARGSVGLEPGDRRRLVFLPMEGDVGLYGVRDRAARQRF